MKIIKIRPLYLYIIFCFIGVFNAFRPTIISGFAYMQTDPGDSLLNNYFLEHSFQVLTNKKYVGELFSPPFFYPYKDVLTFSDNLFGSAPIYWMLRAFFSPDLSYQIWMIVACVLCFVSFATLMRYYRASHVPTLIGSFLFAFGMPRIVQIGHQQLLPQFFTPLAFLFVWDFIKSPKNKQLALSLLFIYLQILSGIYLGWFLILSLIIFTTIVCILDLDTIKRLTRYFQHNYKAVIVMVAVWALLMFAFLAPYIQAQKLFGPRSYTEIDQMLPRLSSWFLPAPSSLWWSLLSPFSKDVPMAGEHHLFLGFLLIILTSLSVYTILFHKDILNFERSLIIKVCLLVTLGLFILCLRLPNGWSIWRFVYQLVPGASAIRAVTRIWTVFYFYLLVAVTLCLDSLLHTVHIKRVRMSVLSLVCIGCLLEQIVTSSPSFEKLPFTKEVTQIQELLQTNCNVAYVILNPANEFWTSQLSAMWAGIRANVPVVNGYSGNGPPNYGDYTKSMNTAQVINWLGEASKGKLCMISQQSLQEKDKLLSIYSVEENNSSFGTWTSHQIQLPIQKIFLQEIKILNNIGTVKVGSTLRIPIFLKNKSNFIWSNVGRNPTNFSYRWLDASGKQPVFQGDGDRTALPFDLSPGESAALNAIIKTPTKPGKYTLILTMVQEVVAWFNDKQAPSPKIDVTVTSD